MITKPHNDSMLFTQLVRILVPFASVCRAAAAPRDSPDGVYATYHNNVEDLLSGQDGIPIHPVDYQGSGKLATAMDQDGNGLEQAEAHLSYYEGRYYLYSATWACGKFVYGRYAGFGNINATEQGSPATPKAPRGPHGMWHQVSNESPCTKWLVNIDAWRTYSSPDLTRWKLEDFYIPPEITITPTKPVVRYSNTTNQYVMLLGNQQLTDLNYLVSKSPAGPFSGPSSPAPGILSGANIGHDFDIAVAPDGSHWLLTDTWGNATLPTDGSGKYPTTVSITWDVVVQKLNPDLVSVPPPTEETFRLIRSASELAEQGLSLEACSFFHHDGHYYMLFSQTCQNCAGYVYYLYSADGPLGPYTDGGILRPDGCGAQNKGASILPTAQSEVVVAAALAYRTSPTSVTVDGLVGHANNNQALSQTFYYPLEFNKDHTIKPWTCPAKVQIPLASNITVQPPEPVAYQLDCRVRNWQSIEVSFDSPRQSKLISFAVYQRNDDVSPAFTPAIIDGPLNITLRYNDLSSSFHVFDPLTISWAPTRIYITPTSNKVTEIHLSTNATTGCFGYIAEPNKEGDMSITSISTFNQRVKTPKARVAFYGF